ncbi:MAG: hypothetical protein IPH20_10880 [Bacteroidales bacterium]|nr:hypothetical protein [Bacteroidales bacterium]
MPYTDGDLLLFKGISEIYSTIVTDVPANDKTIVFTFRACTDIDSSNYTIVKIGTQTWMAENLNVGQRINGNWTQTNNNIFEKYCYANLESNCDEYGGLYQWNEMMQYMFRPDARYLPRWLEAPFQMRNGQSCRIILEEKSIPEAR